MKSNQFTAIVNEIKDDYPLAIAESPIIGHYLYKEYRILVLVRKKLCKCFPGISKDILSKLADSTAGFLERPAVMLRFVQDKETRDHYMQTVASKRAQALLAISKTKTAHLDAPIQLITFVEWELEEKRKALPDSFIDLRNALSALSEQRIASIGENQGNETEAQCLEKDAARINNMREVELAIHAFCICLIKAPVT